MFSVYLISSYLFNLGSVKLVDTLHLGLVFKSILATSLFLLLPVHAIIFHMFDLGPIIFLFLDYISLFKVFNSLYLIY